ncbi:Hypothetical predicted protein [Cloeon dipterum]|uniref:Methyltransferase domain-containing protein n=1 Tax=Cloeon dipterum TaxID=197152 RepID=A0A8S1DZE3_9INSE|nr:Hypothetical predicted protein [Cloeon dipterum]
MCDQTGSVPIDFDDFISTLRKYEWIFNFPVTDLLTSKVLENVTHEWRSLLLNLSSSALNKLAAKDSSQMDDIPHILTNFVEECKRLSFNLGHEVPPTNATKLRLKGVSEKKCMEISMLSSRIDSECKKLGVNHIVDLGCGVGYLAHILNEKLGYTVLGLELQDSLVQTASSRSNSGVRFKQIEVRVGEDGNSKVEEVITEWLADTNGTKACLIGLHTCGDLAASTLRLFASSSFLSSLVFMPCCFHKLEVKNETAYAESFALFPLSEKLKKAVSKYNGKTFLRRPLLRLAAQMSAHKWGHMTEQEHKQHSMHVLCRAAVQLFAIDNRLQLLKVKRKALRKGALKLSEDELVDDMMARFELKDTQGNTCNMKEAAEGVKCIVHQNLGNLQLIEGLTALQCCLQEPADCLMFSDMQQFLTEHDLHLNRVELMWDETLSPRSHAIIATRNHTS